MVQTFNPQPMKYSSVDQIVIFIQCIHSVLAEMFLLNVDLL